MWAEPRCVVLWGDVVWCEVLTSMVSVVKEATRASLSGVMCREEGSFGRSSPSVDSCHTSLA